jgi:hypothetical protein
MMKPTPNPRRDSATTHYGLPQSLIDSAKVAERVPFDPKKHLNIQMPEKILKMEDIGYPGLGISSTAVSDPFPIFTEEAVVQMRAEVFDEKTITRYHVSSKFAAHIVRGFASEYVLSWKSRLEY